jgi:uncharacterized protein YjdB
MSERRRDKRGFRPLRQSVTAPAYPEVITGRRTFLKQLGLLSGGAASALVLLRCPLDGGGAMMNPMIFIEPEYPSVDLGQTVQLKATSSEDNRDVTAAATWDSDDPTVASVDPKGLVTGLAGGFANITAEYGGYTGTSSLTVRGKPIQRLTLTPENPGLQVGQTVSLEARVYYTDGSSEVVNERARWFCDRPSVAKVFDVAGAKGQVTALAAGETNITASLTTTAGVTSVTTKLTVTA